MIPQDTIHAVNHAAHPFQIFPLQNSYSMTDIEQSLYYSCTYCGVIDENTFAQEDGICTHCDLGEVEEKPVPDGFHSFREWSDHQDKTDPIIFLMIMLEDFPD